MKKNISKMILINLIVILIFCLVVFPVKTTGLTAVTDCHEASKKTDVVVHVTLSEEVEVFSGIITLEYDKEALDYRGSAFSIPSATQKSWDDEKEVGTFVIENGGYISGSLISVVFRTLEGAKIGENPVKINVQLFDINNNEIDVINVPGYIKIGCVHSFKIKDVSEDSLVVPATCKTKAKYRYTCENCGEKSAMVFEYGSLEPHKFTKQDVDSKYLASVASCTKKAQYYYSCSECGEKGDTVFEYGSLEPHKFTKQDVDSKYLASVASCTKKAQYYYSCNDCGAKGIETFSSGDVAEHDFSKKIETVKYMVKFGACTEIPEYYYACSVCEEKGTVTYKGSTAKGHVFGDKWYTDTNNHWHECDNCVEKKDLAAHTPGEDATETTPQTCTTCGYVIKAALGHEHNFDVTEYKTDANNHWYECSCGEKAEVKAHTYDSDCDKDCNGCGYEREVTHTFGSWVSDDANHWKECSCGEKAEVAAHVPGAEATETTPQTCTVCNHVLKEATNHTHNYGSEWKKDSENHWHECDCGDKKDVSAHKFYNSVVKEEATEDKEGLKVYTCDCGYEKTETLPKLEPAKKGCKKDLAALVVGLISLSMVGVLLKKKEN